MVLACPPRLTRLLKFYGLDNLYIIAAQVHARKNFDMFKMKCSRISGLCCTLQQPHKSHLCLISTLMTSSFACFDQRPLVIEALGPGRVQECQNQRSQFLSIALRYWIEVRFLSGVGQFTHKVARHICACSCHNSFGYSSASLRRAGKVDQDCSLISI